MREESSGKPDAWKLARPVWGWGRGEIPRPTPPARARYTQDQVDDSAAQLLLYGELVKDFSPGKKLTLQFGVLTKTKEVGIDTHRFAFDQSRLDRTKRIVERVWQAIQAEHFFSSTIANELPWLRKSSASRPPARSEPRATAQPET